MKKLTSALFICLGFVYAQAQEATDEPTPRVLNAIGYSEIEYKYDLAHLGYQFSFEAETQEEAQNKLAEAQKKFDALLLETKIGEDRIENGNAQLTTIPKSSGLFSNNIENMYVASLERTIDFTNFEEMKAFAESAAGLEIKSNVSLSFDLQDSGSLEEGLINKAIANAKENAIADASNVSVKLGTPREIGLPSVEGIGSTASSFIIDKNNKMVYYFEPKGVAYSQIAISYEMASPNMSSKPKTALEVFGDSYKSMKPEFATTTIAMRETAKTFEEAEALLAKRLAGLKTALATTGLPADSMTYNPMRLDYVYAEKEGSFLSSYGYVDGYEVSQSVDLEFKDLTQISEILAKLVAAGFDSYEEVAFKIRDEKPVEAEVRKTAFEKAHKTALARAVALGMKLGAPITVNRGDEDGVGNLAYESPADASVPGMEKSKVQKIETKIEDVEFSDSVYIRYELLPN